MYDIGVSSLALLAFLGAGNSEVEGRYKDTVRNGIRWLKAQQDAKGCFRTTEDYRYPYMHAMATLAMVENAIALRRHGRARQRPKGPRLHREDPIAAAARLALRGEAARQRSDGDRVDDARAEGRHRSRPSGTTTAASAARRNSCARSRTRGPSARDT